MEHLVHVVGTWHIEHVIQILDKAEIKWAIAAVRKDDVEFFVQPEDHARAELLLRASY